MKADPSPITWREYKERVAELAPTNRLFKIKRTDGTRLPLFRGHQDQTWELESTLWRYRKREMMLRHYFSDCQSAWSILKSHRLSDAAEFDPSVSSLYKDVRDRIPEIAFLAFLRHHGFPSPLLDWSESPYIAAFFALEDAAPAGRNPCVFVYEPGSNITKADEPHVSLVGPFIGTAQRHATQQCWYSASIRKGIRGETLFCSHGQAFDGLDRLGGRPGNLEKIVILASERDRALAELAYMNITTFSLYGGTDALIKTITPRIIEGTQ